MKTIRSLAAMLFFLLLSALLGTITPPLKQPSSTLVTARSAAINCPRGSQGSRNFFKNGLDVQLVLLHRRTTAVMALISADTPSAGGWLSGSQ